MQPGVNFRVTHKNVEQLVVVKDAVSPAISPFGKSSANDRHICAKLRSAHRARKVAIG
jgi:hypothetical protein